MKDISRSQTFGGLVRDWVFKLDCKGNVGVDYRGQKFWAEGTAK